MPTHDATTTASLARLACLRDYETCARQRLPADVWAYLHGGSADGVTQAWNEQAFQRLALLPRVLGQVAGGHTALELFGFRYEHPVFIAPTAYHALAHPDGEYATALAASALNTPFTVSTQASVSLEDIGRTAQCPLWFQLYWQSDRSTSLSLLQRAEQAGYRAIVVTLDAPIQGLRNAEQRHGFQLPAHIRPVNLLPYAQAGGQASLSAGESLLHHPLVARLPDWDDMAWLMQQTRLPVLLKGILHPLDVAPALQAGAAGIIVSNHGGRVLDTVPATLEVLPRIVAAVDGRIPVLVDGGIRRGTDILKALALGASAIMVGRPILHGLAVAGATGVAHVLNLLRRELEAAMVLTGCRTLADIHTSLLMPCREDTA